MKNYLFLIFTIVFINNVVAQEKLIDYLGGSMEYYSHGVGEHLGLATGINVINELNTFNSIGVKASYFKNSYNSLKFSDPFSAKNYSYDNTLHYFKTFIFLQYTPLNTKHIDIGFNIGPTIGVLNHTFWEGGYHTDYNTQTFYVDINDVGSKGMSFGFESSFFIRLETNQVFFSPGISIGTDIEDNSFSMLFVDIGYKF
jgi:hypothetical protein